ncbi:MAG: tyrosine-type recombinase/integrase [Candidatus Dormibacter sp.]|uniref:tyrosine-type recombinase/integrase n=1 Tax=Candidatus Dormibacter sp. TaxID=2973982 RepID=UPI000DB588D9|nr:MAG: site-specific integrase [Candidatus Dormibacteraeota bacterium]
MTARRGHGEGSIFRRKDGLWAGSVNLGRRDGQRRRKTVYGRTRREVQEKVVAALRDQQLGVLPSTGTGTVAQFLATWLENSAKPRLRPSTYRSYSDLIHLHLIPSLGHLRLDRLGPAQVQAMLNAKLASGLSPRRVEFLRAVLRTSLNQAIKWEMLTKNAAALADSPRVTRRPVQVLSPAEAQRLLDAARDDRFEAVYAVALSLGLRQGEALGLRWQDIDLTEQRLTVVHALQRVDGKLTLVEPKTARSRRSIKVPAVIADILAKHRKRQFEDRLRAGARWQHSDLVFTTTIGTPLEGTTVTHRFPHLLAAAGLPRIRFHDLRHSCASLLLAQGVSPRVVMETLGHSQISLTMNTYSHVIPAVQAEAANAMDRILTRHAPTASQ